MLSESPKTAFLNAQTPSIEKILQLSPNTPKLQNSVPNPTKEVLKSLKLRPQGSKMKNQCISVYGWVNLQRSGKLTTAVFITKLNDFHRFALIEGCVTLFLRPKSVRVCSKAENMRSTSQFHLFW